MAEIDKGKLERYRKGELRFTQIFSLTAAQIASILISGHNYFTEGRLEDARKIFEGLSVLDPKNPYIQTMLGAIYQRMEKYEKAITRYSLALSIHPKDVYALTNRAEAYLVLGKFLEAAEDLKKVLNINFQKNPMENRARLLSMMTAEALKEVKREREREGSRKSHAPVA